MNTLPHIRKQPDWTDRTELLNALWCYQDEHGYITDDDIAECAGRLGLSEVEVEGVVSFYHFFHRQPVGDHIVYLDNSIISETRGFQRVREAFERESGAAFNADMATGSFALFETACIGLSDQAPAALIDFHPFTHLNSLKVRRIMDHLRKGGSPSEIADEVPDNIRHFPPKEKCVFFREYHPGIALSELHRMTPEEVIGAVKASGLAGMGGAFFPTGLKWELCRKESAETKYVVCNADEGEPGTFKDRVLLNNMPGLLLEGMILAGFAIGAKEGVIYLRAEYTWLLEKLYQAIDRFHRMGLLGRDAADVKGFDFDIRVQVGAGAYVCGEETALLNSIEGLRGEPRTKLYFPTQRGYLGKPTVVNNVETLCAAARVIELGPDHFRNAGTPGSPGTKLLSVSGDCHKPGVYEIEWGTTVKEVLQLCEAADPWYIQVSGPSGECVSMEESGRRISREDLRCGGSFMIFDSSRDLLDILSNFAEFFKHESCGICTPCRAGNFIIQRKLEKLQCGLTYEADIADIRNWGSIMAKASRCGLGKAATRTLVAALDKFPGYFEKNMDGSGGVNICFDVDKAVEDYEKFRT